MSLGRWGITVFDHIRGGLVSPIISSIISIFFISITTVLIIKIFKIKDKVAIVLLSVLIISAPTIATTLSYYYCSDSYTFSILLATLSVYFMEKSDNRKIDKILSIIFIALSLSLYQSSIGIIVTLCIMNIIVKCLKKEVTLKDLILDIGIKLMIGVLGCILYLILSEIFMKIYGTTWATYKGADNIGLLSSISNIMSSVKNIYFRFYQYNFEDSILKNSYWNREYLNLFIILIMIVTAITLIIKNKIYRQLGKLIILISCFIILPMGMGIIEIINPQTSINLLMSMPYILIIVLGIILAEKLNSNSNFNNLLKWTVEIIVTMIIITYVLSNNATYMALEMANNQLYSYTIRIMDRIETSEEYNEDMGLAIIGSLETKEYPRNSQIYQMGNEENQRIIHKSYGGSKKTWEKFIHKYLGIEVRMCSEKTYNKIIESDEFKSMGVFPAKDSVKVINGIMVVKLTENPVKP